METIKPGTMHPDLMLLMQTDRREICCLVLEDTAPEQLGELAACGPFYAFAWEGMVALLFDDTHQVSWRETIRDILVRNHLCAGLSGPFALAASAQGCMQKAQIALKTGKAVHPGCALYPMDAYFDTALFRAASQVLETWGYLREDYCDARLLQMERLDAKEGTQYVDSLHAYLRNGLNLRLAAQSLGIHRNTLDYRIRRIQTLFDVDFGNKNTCFEWLFALWVRDHLPDNGPGEEPAADFDLQAAQMAMWRYLERIKEDEAPRSAFSVALLCIGTEGESDARRTELLLQLCSEGEGWACAFDESMICLAVEPQQAQACLQTCLRVCEAYGRPIVTTQPFSSSRIRWRLELCRFALRAFRTPVTPVQDVGSILFFVTLAQRMSLSPYLCESVLRVMDEDAQRGTALSHALYAYLLNFMDLKEAAAQLGIHRNTMEYQVRKIEGLTGETLDEHNRFFMMCTYRMLALPDVGVWTL